MAIFVEAKAPDKLLGAIKNTIECDMSSKWLCDSDGDFTSINDGMAGQAWFHPYELQDFLAFGIMGRKDVKLSNLVFTKYHSEFLNFLLLNFGSYISTIIIKSPFKNEFDTKNLENNFNID